MLICEGTTLMLRRRRQLGPSMAGHVPAAPKEHIGAQNTIATLHRLLPMVMVVLVGCAPSSSRPDAGAGMDANLDGAIEVFADTIWQVRCPPGLASCATDGAPHNVFGFNGQEDGSEGEPGAVLATCRVSPVAAGYVAVDLSVSIGAASPGGGSSLSIRNAVVPEGGGSLIGVGCTASITDDDVTYNGQCVSRAPTATLPCQLTDITLDPDGTEGPTVQTSLYCTNLTSPADPTRFIRDVERGGSPRGTPAVLRFIFCSGL